MMAALTRMIPGAVAAVPAAAEVAVDRAAAIPQAAPVETTTLIQAKTVETTAVIGRQSGNSHREKRMAQAFLACAFFVELMKS